MRGPSTILRDAAHQLRVPHLGDKLHKVHLPKACSPYCYSKLHCQAVLLWCWAFIASIEARLDVYLGFASGFRSPPAKELRHLSYSELLGPTSQASAGCQEGPLLLLPCSVVMSWECIGIWIILEQNRAGLRSTCKARQVHEQPFLKGANWHRPCQIGDWTTTFL